MPEIPRDFVESYKPPMDWRAAFGQSAVAFAAGLMAGLGQVPFSLIFLSLPGFAAMFWIVRRAATPKGSMILGFAAGCGYFAITLFWIMEPFFVNAARHAWMAPFALLFMSAGLAIFWGLAARLARALAGPEPGALPLAVAWVTMMTLAELGRTYLFTGFPWAMPGYIWSETAFAQLGAVVGPHGLNFMTFAFAAALTGFAWQGVPAKISGVLGAVGPVGIAFGMAFIVPPALPGDGPMLRLVQPNAPQHLKWKPDMIPVFFERSLLLSSTPSEVKPDLIIWPETSTPKMLNNPKDSLEQIARAADGAEAIVGGIRRNADGLFNALIVVTPDGSVAQSYEKHRLVPFGEYTPLVPSIAALGWQEMADTLGSGYTPGSGPGVLQSTVAGPFQPLICYEAIFPQTVNGAPSRPRWLLQITNDAWFGQIAGPQQHLAQARMRAIEQGLPMVRVANTGITAMIDARGHVLGSIPLGTHGYLDLRLPGPLPPTVYARLGDWPILVLLALCALVSVIERRRITD